MRPALLRCLCAAVALGVIAPAASADGGSEADGLEEIERCIRANSPERTAVQRFRIADFDASGEIRSIAGKLWWRRSDDGLSKISAHVDAPADMRDSAFLLIENDGRNDMFVYLPEFRKTRRITSRTVSGSLFGTEFTYEDFEHLRGIGGSAKRERLADTEHEGRPAYQLAAMPTPDSGSAYARIVSTIDRETCVPLDVRFFSDAEELKKRLSVDPESITREGGVWVSRRATLANPSKQRESRLEIVEVELDVEVPKSFFSQSRLGRLK